MDTSLLCVLLLSAVSIGWLLGVYTKSKKDSVATAYHPPDEIKHRLQLFFDSYNDESMDKFVQSLEVSPATLAIHISIGKHFRAQGEVEKAILIHQNLLARPDLSDSASESIIYELAQDYKAAGLFDRAEVLLLQLSNSKQFAVKSLNLLLDIYEREHEWEKAVLRCEQIDPKRHSVIVLRIAHYYCELAEEKLVANDLVAARQFFNQAMSRDNQCVRAHIGMAQLAIGDKDYASAISQLTSVAELSPENIVLILPLLLECTVATQSYDRHQSYLAKLFDETGQTPVMLALVESLVVAGERQKAHAFLLDQLINAPGLSVLDTFLADFFETSDGQFESISAAVAKVIDGVKISRPNYQCSHCGFAGERHYWLCPSCSRWQTILPVVEYQTNPLPVDNSERSS